MPVSSVLLLRQFVRDRADALFPELQSILTNGRTLRNSFLADRLAGSEFGEWSFSASTLNFLEDRLRVLRPKLVLEFGSGLSTVCLAHYMRELYGDSRRVCIFSIEQELNYAMNTMQLLEAAQLHRQVRIIHSPLRQQVIEGIRTICYDLNPDFLNDALGDERPDFVVIDGPSAEAGARLGTLPLVRQFLSPGAWFFLDDALRDGELRVAQMWDRLPYIKVVGICFVGKGLLVGRVGGAVPLSSGVSSRMSQG